MESSTETGKRKFKERGFKFGGSQSRYRFNCKNIKCWNHTKELVAHLLTVMQKNLRIRKRRYVALIIELTMPIIVVSLLAVINSHHPIFRALPLEDLKAYHATLRNASTAGSGNSEQFYDPGSDYQEETLADFTLCRYETVKCFIGYVADNLTATEIIENAEFYKSRYFRRAIIKRSKDPEDDPVESEHDGTVFVKFSSEEHVEECLKSPENCPELYNDRNNILRFRGVVVFESGVGNKEIRYKIRLLERYFNSLKHVYKTSRIYPSLFDKREYVKSYIKSGFLSMQLQINRMILIYLNRTIVPPNSNKTLGNQLEDKFMLHETPHRQSDQQHADSDELFHDDLTHAGGANDNDERTGFISEAKKFQQTENEDKNDRRKLICTLSLVLSFAFIIPSEQRRIVSDKEKGLSDLLLVTGMTHRIQWIGNLFSVVVTYIPTIIIVTILLVVRFNVKEGAVFENASPVSLGIIMFLYLMALSVACYFIATFFDNPVLAVTVATSVFIVSFIAFFYVIEILYDSLSVFVKLILCLHPRRTTPADNITLLHIAFMFIFQTFLYISLAFYVDLVLDPRHGKSHPWYYPCKNVIKFCSGMMKNKVEPGNAFRKSRRSLDLHFESDSSNEFQLQVPEVEVEQSKSEISIVPVPPPANGESEQVAINMDDQNADENKSVKVSRKTRKSKVLNKRGIRKSESTIRQRFSNSQIPDNEKDRSTAESTPVVNAPGFEPYHEQEQPSVESIHLTKMYGKKEALKDLNIKLYHGEIFALLGPNGAGKSTFLNLLSGLIAPTAGTAIICGHDLRTQPIQIQAFTGICTQVTTLFDDLTPLEHVLIFGRLRGLPATDAYEEGVELIEKLYLSEVMNLVTRSLSNGDRRKLQLAIAIIGNPTMILLDEPTSGMDYYSRRAVWDVLLKIRQNHTIVFTTHYTDEAELLGDKIGIMVQGKMEVMGSPHFIRRYFGLGYSLRMKMDREKTVYPDKILEAVRGSMPGATRNDLPTHPSTQNLFVVNIPESEYSAKAMSALFSNLNQTKESLGILGFSISTSPMDEVFLTLLRSLDVHAEEVADIVHDDEVHVYQPKTKFYHSVFQLGVLIKKKIMFTKRNKYLTFSQLFFPSVLGFLGIWRLCYLIDLDGRTAPPMTLSLDEISGAKVYVFNSTKFPTSVMEAAIGKEYTYSSGSQDISGWLINKGIYSSSQTSFVAGISTDPADNELLNLYFSPYLLHSSAIVLNIHTNILLKVLDMERSITTINHPLVHPYFDGVLFEDDNMAVDSFAGLMILTFTLMIGFTIVFPLKERLTEMKHLQLMSGVSSSIYWAAIVIWDLVLVFISLILVRILIFLHPGARKLQKLASADPSLAIGSGIIILSFGYGGMMMVYSFTNFARSVSGGFTLLIGSSLMFGVIIPFFTLSVSVVDDENSYSSMYHLPLYLIPFYSAAAAFRKYGICTLGNGRCNHFSEEGATYYCNPDRNLSISRVDIIQISCCRECSQIMGSSGCYDRNAILHSPWSTFYHSYAERETGSHLYDKEITKDILDSPSAFYEVLCLVGVATMFNFLTIFLDSNVWRYFEACVFGMRGRAFQTDVEDDDVNDEIERVQEIVDSRERIDGLVVHELCKTFGIFPAVHNVSFGMPSGECFGIIGVNGAGKSTLFRLITAFTVETYGNVYSRNHSLTKGRAGLMNLMGYSPHHGQAVLTFLTPAENLKFFAQLRGLPAKAADQEIKEILNKMKIENIANDLVKHIGGGLRRRLNFGIAMLAQPPILLFDEPTSTADPASRRIFWEAIEEAKRLGQTIIFNSHRIQEVEALCDRIGILIDGKFQCIGSRTHLKNKFGRGYSLVIKLVAGPAENQGYVSSLSNAVVQTFLPCSLRDRRRNVIQYVIHDSRISWDYLFKSMEHIKIQYNDLVEDYAFSETTLDEVFLSFVTLQNCGRKRDVALCHC